MKKYVVETYYTCTFKTVHNLDNLDEAELSKIDKRSDGNVEVIDVKRNEKLEKLEKKEEKTNNAKVDQSLSNNFINNKTVKDDKIEKSLNLTMKNNARFKMPDRRKGIYSESSNR